MNSKDDGVAEITTHTEFFYRGLCQSHADWSPPPKKKLLRGGQYQECM